MSSYRRRLGAASIILAALAAGCAERVPTASPPTFRAPAPPSLRTESGPPKGPTDTSAAGWFTGTVRAADGSCFGLVTDDGTEYAVIADAPEALERNERIRARLVADPAGADCGSGQPMRVLEIRRVG